MKAVIYKGSENIEVEEVEHPKIGKPTGAIIRITGSDIYGIGLHIYGG